MGSPTRAPQLHQLDWQQSPQLAPGLTSLRRTDPRMILHGTSSVAQSIAHLSMKTETSVWANFRTTPFTPAAIQAIEAAIAGELKHLDRDEMPPTRAAAEAWQRLLLSVATEPMPVPIVSVLGQGGLRLTWRSADRRLFLTIFPDGHIRQRQVEISDEGARGGRSVSDPAPQAVRQAVAWLTRA